MSPVFMEITIGVGFLAKQADFCVGDGVLAKHASSCVGDGVLAKHAEVRGADVPFRSTLARRVRAE